MIQELQSINATIDKHNICHCINMLLDLDLPTVENFRRIKIELEARRNLFRNNNLDSDIWNEFRENVIERVKLAITESIQRLENNNFTNASAHIKTLLLLASSPTDLERNNTDIEIKELFQTISNSKSIKFIPKLAVTKSEISTFLEDEKPDIFHFTGHSAAEGLFVQDRNRRSLLVKTEEISELFSKISHSTECVLLNSCTSYLVAESISRSIEGYAIGMQSPINQNTSAVFSKLFYKTLFKSYDYENAFHSTLAALKFNNHRHSDIPILFKNGIELKQEPNIQS